MSDDEKNDVARRGDKARWFPSCYDFRVRTGPGYQIVSPLSRITLLKHLREIWSLRPARYSSIYFGFPNPPSDREENRNTTIYSDRKRPISHGRVTKCGLDDCVTERTGHRVWGTQYI